MSTEAAASPRLGRTSRTDRWWAAPTATAFALVAFGIYSYYRAFFRTPPACAVASTPRRRPYSGEAKLPFILQNVHRYFMYLAVIVLAFLWYDAGRAFFFRNGHGALEFGVGLGSLIMLANVILISLFTFGCNSVRHLIGGRLDCFTCSAGARTRHRLWRGGSACSTDVTCNGPGSASRASGRPISTSASRHRACSTARGSSNVGSTTGRRRTPPVRRAGDRSGG